MCVPAQAQNYSVVTTLTKNTAVTITAEAKDSNGTLWYKITAGNKKGYVHSSYLTKKNAQAIPEITAAVPTQIQMYPARQ